ncbi:MAG TPA: TonB C-terminal domain-containing protein [Terracidiphilus sp.]|nr:TonB C-terminal domain-containing protein [Terracidiphilus sp.]
MESVLESSEHLERELAREPFAAPAVGSIVLHGAIVGLILSYAWAMGLFHHNFWGAPGAGGSMQVTLTTSLPLPNEQVNKNVLATETPSQAPAAPAPKEQKHIDETAIPILGKPPKPTPLPTTPKTLPHQAPPQPNVAQYGEQQGSVMPHQMQPGTSGPTTVGDNNFASLFPWYVDQINRKMSQAWNKGQVDPRTPKGARVFLAFTIYRDGSHSQPTIDTSSGSPTLDTSCLFAAQRVDTFGQLPANYNQRTLKVSYYCEY